MEVSTNKSEKVKLDFKDSKYATGRRKTSIAKVWLKKGSGKIYVNGKNYEDYFKRPIHKMQLLRPFDIINQSTNYDVRCNVKGGGLTGQVGAMVHGISKALLMFDSELKTTLKKEKLTTIDSRSVERKKYGHRKARRSFQFSKDNYFLISTVIINYVWLNALIAGSTGYIGLQLIKLLDKHPNIQIKYLCGNTSIVNLFINLIKILKIKNYLKLLKNKLTKDVELVFTSLPNGEAQKYLITY